MSDCGLLEGLTETLSLITLPCSERPGHISEAQSEGTGERTYNLMSTLYQSSSIYCLILRLIFLLPPPRVAELSESYQLQLSPVQLLYSFSLCGFWHPLAATAFTQHWNKQGLVRCRMLWCGVVKWGVV